MREFKELTGEQVSFLMRMYYERNSKEFDLGKYEKYELERMYAYIRENDPEIDPETTLQLNYIRSIYITNVLKKKGNEINE